ncbi:signal peptidase I [Mucilaginibacter gracilis]|uniref:signal peptidase I n=1 Tax=Mucilaginibacter gracilis TaxID=423350 RepID=UPI0013C2CE7E
MVQIVIFSWIVGRLTHTIGYYTFATESNMPTHHVGEIFFTSNLKKPDYNRFVCFKNEATKNSIYIFRVIGKPNDVIEIRDGYVYRNGSKLNEPFTWNQYQLSAEEYQRIAGFVEKNHNQLDEIGNNYMVSLTDGELQQYHLTMARYAAFKGKETDYIYPDFKAKGYNADNFGPVKIPAGSYFLLGDNRHNALDSRYFGFVKAEEILGVKLGD